MRKFFLFFSLFFAVACVADDAKDIIVTQKAERIEALITEVTPTEIKYHKYSNPSGPIFVLYITDVAAVIYKNGEVQIFAKSQAQQIQTEKPQTTQLAENNDAQLPYLTMKKVKVEGKKRPKWRYCSNDGSIVMTENEFVSMLQSACPEAYAQYRKSSRLGLAGAILTLIPPIGLILDFVALGQVEEVLPIYNSECATSYRRRK